MKNLSELEDLYHGRLKHNLSSLEASRKKILNKFLLSIFGAILSLLVLVLYFTNADEPNAIIPIVIGLFLVFCLGIFIMAFKAKKIYRRQYKTEVVSEVVRAVNPDWNYDPDRKITSSDYRKSDLFRRAYDKYEGDDLISGLIDKTDFECSELHTQYKVVTYDKNGRRKEHWHTIFRGLFFHADFNKLFKGQTYVTPDYAEKIFGKWGQKFQKFSGKGSLVKLENPDFEKTFVVHSTDQIEARYILTPAIMEALLRIKDEYKRPVHFSFIDSRVYCALSFNNKLFEPKIIRSGVKFSDISSMYHLFLLNETIIKELNLNTRIWTKK